MIEMVCAFICWEKIYSQIKIQAVGIRPQVFLPFCLDTPPHSRSTYCLLHLSLKVEPVISALESPTRLHSDIILKLWMQCSYDFSLSETPAVREEMVSRMLDSIILS